MALEDNAHRAYLQGIEADKTHNGYFSIDKKSKRMTDPSVGARSVDSDDVDAYDLILKDKERLLSFDEPTRFIFSHSALREGWDNPNVFVMCMLKHSDNMISRRQEVGRGLRLAVNRHGDRMDQPASVNDINVLTVVASESYKNFVGGLQKEIFEALSARPRQANEAYFNGKSFVTEAGPVNVSPDMAAGIEFYLVQNGYVDRQKNIVEKYHKDKETGLLAPLPIDLLPHATGVFQLIDSVFSDKQLPGIGDARQVKINALNANFDKREFQELWAKINRKAVYRVEFNSAELIAKCHNALNTNLRVTRMQYTVREGIQQDVLTHAALGDGMGFREDGQATLEGGPSSSTVKYDLIGRVAEGAELTRRTVADILGGIDKGVFGQFRDNPEHFIAEAIRLIVEQKATMIVEHLKYSEINERYDVDIFTAAQNGQDFSKALGGLKNHIFDYLVTDSATERSFAHDLDTSHDVVVYAKLPRGFVIPTPVGDYNPDWAISFKTGTVRHIFFVAETKGDLSSLEMRGTEKGKTDCAQKFFEEVGKSGGRDAVKYGVLKNYGQLLDVVKPIFQLV